MECWEDQAIVLAVRGHGENGAIVSLLTEKNGRQCGYVRGARSSKMRGTLEPGNIVDARWQARVSDNLGTLSLELSSSPVSHVMDDSLRLGALQSACALCDSALPEREGHEGLFHGVLALFQALQGEVWAESYVMWEIALLRELGFSLDLSRCAGGGDHTALAYVSPKTGRSVSIGAGEPYKDKLLILPAFLGGVLEEGEAVDIFNGLTMTGYFLEHWVYIHHTKGVPDVRIRLLERFGNTVINGGQALREALKQAL